MKKSIKPIKKETNICLGFECNNHCLFCCEGHNRSLKSKTTKQAMEDIMIAKKNGSERINFLGGEPTIRKDLPVLISFSKKQGFRQIFIVTNGRLCSDMNYCKRLVDSGLTHILFSLNGSNKKIHDELTQVPGSFDQIIQGIKNMKKFTSINVHNNTTITKLNYRDLPNISGILVDLGIDDFEFIFVNPSGFAKDNFARIIPNYAQIAPFLHKSLKIGINAKIRVNAESIPYCHMKGYEKHMTENYMAEIREKIMPHERINDLKKSRLENVKAKGPECINCRYHDKCEGIWDEYAKRKGFKELKPINR